jgi:Uncharacterized proteins, LmbE homologs
MGKRILKRLNMKKRILVIAVHPDDETLGCGGSLLRFKQEEHSINIIFVTAMTKEMGYSMEQINSRKKEIQMVCDEYGFESVYELGFPAGSLEEVPKSDIIKKMKVPFEKIKPEIVFLPYAGDPQKEHYVTFETAYSLTKIFRYPSIKEILVMETPSETDFSSNIDANHFIPNYFIDISNFLDKKLETMSIYKSEIGEHPFPRSNENIKAWATVRGAQAGVKYAEAFMLIKKIV